MYVATHNVILLSSAIVRHYKPTATLQLRVYGGLDVTSVGNWWTSCPWCLPSSAGSCDRVTASMISFWRVILCRHGVWCGYFSLLVVLHLRVKSDVKVCSLIHTPACVLSTKLYISNNVMF